jgi:hypothetical protein
MAVIDMLKLARDLRERGGFSPTAAEATAEALNNAFGEQVATKRDVTDLGTGLRAEIARLAHRIDQIGSDLRREMAELKADLLKWVVGIVGFQTVAILGGVAALIHLVK